MDPYTYPNAGIYTPPQNTIKVQDVFQLLESDQLIADIHQKLSGVVVTVKDGKLTAVRIKKPTITHEFVFDPFITTLRSCSNTVTAQTSWKIEEINRRQLNLMEHLIKEVAISGKENYVTANSWKRILEIHNTRGRWVVEDGKKTFVSGWVEVGGINWSYNDGVTREMLDVVRLPNDDDDQHATMGRIISQMQILIDAALRRSAVTLPGVTMEHQQQIVTQKYVDGTQNKKTVSEQMSSGISNIT